MFLDAGLTRVTYGASDSISSDKPILLSFDSQYKSWIFLILFWVGNTAIWLYCLYLALLLCLHVESPHSWIAWTMVVLSLSTLLLPVYVKRHAVALAWRPDIVPTIGDRTGSTRVTHILGRNVHRTMWLLMTGAPLILLVSLIWSFL